MIRASASLFLVLAAFLSGVPRLKTEENQHDEPVRYSNADYGEGPDLDKMMFHLESMVDDESADRAVQRYNEAFKDLKSLLSYDILHDVCSQHTYNKIRSFHVRYVHYYLPEMTRHDLVEEKKKWKELEPDSRLPKLLREFFIMFVKQINLKCKVQILDRLTNKSLLNPDYADQAEDIKLIKDFMQEIQRLAKSNRLVKGLLASAGGARVSKLTQLRITDPAPDERKLYIQLDRVSENLDVTKLKAVCKMRLRPIYMETFAPVIRLNSLGYIERTLSNDLLRGNEQFSDWLTIIQVCEAIENVEFVVAPEPVGDNKPSKMASNTRRGLPSGVKILSFGDAQELIGTGGRPEPALKLLAIPHKRTHFGALFLLGPKDWRREVKSFDLDMKRLVSARTSNLSRNPITRYLMHKYHDLMDTNSYRMLMKFIEISPTISVLISVAIFVALCAMFTG